MKLDLLYTVLLHLLALQASCSDQGTVMEGKMRLGSTPPSCHNRCSECHPCMAVQVPTQPSRGRAQAEEAAAAAGGSLVPYNSKLDDEKEVRSISSKKYSNYKPLGWKCRCGNGLFNP